MKALVVYESFWGNTAAVARAIAEGIGSGAVALPTDGAAGEALAGVDLLVVGAPLMAFSLPTDATRRNIEMGRGAGKPAPDVSHPSLRSWLAALPAGKGQYAAFETRFRWSPGSATGRISRELERAGYRALAKPLRALIKGMYGPLQEGELDRARQWGAELARLAP